MSRVWINGLSGIVLAALLSACATSKEQLLTHRDATMLDIWNQETGGVPSGPSERQLSNARQVLRRPMSEAEARTVPAITASYTRTAQNEIYRQFQRLPNPDLVMYVFPHLAGGDPVPVPGYSTVFPLYQRVQYALPGERIENY